MKLRKGSLQIVQLLHELGGYTQWDLAIKLDMLDVASCVYSRNEGIGIYYRGFLALWLNPSGTMDVLNTAGCWRDNLTIDEVLSMHHNNTL